MVQFFLFFFNDTATTEIYTLSLHDALPISPRGRPVPWRRSGSRRRPWSSPPPGRSRRRSEEHTSELQSRQYLVCRLLLEKKKILYYRFLAGCSSILRPCSPTVLSLQFMAFC